MQKRCLVFYMGAGYIKDEPNYYGSYSYSVDMRENRSNHYENVFSKLENNGYHLDFCLLTNKHEMYEEFVKDYNAINIEYDEISQSDLDCLEHYYFKLKVPTGEGPGTLRSGGRFLKIKSKIPEYDIYVFLRADLLFKKSIDQLSIDFDKINYLWVETDHKFFSNRDEFIAEYGSEFYFWNLYNRVSGNTFNIVAKKYINMFTNYIWSDHMSLHLMISDLHPLVSIDDINIMCGFDCAYVSDANKFENPIFTFNKHITQQDLSI
jgi:hypothetical protein